MISEDHLAFEAITSLYSKQFAIRCSLRKAYVTQLLFEEVLYQFKANPSVHRNALLLHNEMNIFGFIRMDIGIFAAYFYFNTKLFGTA